MSESILETVRKITEGERQRDYAHPLTNHLRIAIMGSVLFQKTIDPITCAMFLGAVLKTSREVNTPKFDNYLDIVGYMKCIDEMGIAMVKLNKAPDKFSGIKVLKTLSVGEMWELLELCEESL